MRVVMVPAFRHRDADPYPYLLATALERAGVDVEDLDRVRLRRDPPDILHIHWPEHALRGVDAAHAAAGGLRMLRSIAHARRAGTRLVWTVHNLDSHEAPWPLLTRSYAWAFRRRVDGVVHLSPTARSAAERRHPRLADLPAEVIHLGHLRDEYPASSSRTQARTQFGLAADRKVLVHFGRIRRYKGTLELLDAFRDLRDEGTTLLVAGTIPSAELLDEIERRAALDPRVVLHVGRVAREDAHAYFAVSDLAVFPFQRIFNSSSLLLALSLDVPSLAPDMASVRDVAACVGRDWLRTYHGPITASVLADALEWASRPRPSPVLLTAFSWPEIAERTAALYRRLVRPAD